MPREERERWLNERLAEQVQFAYKNAPAIKEKFDKVGVSPSEIRTMKDLERLPVTTKDDLVKLQQESPPFGGFLAVPLNSLSRIYSTMDHMVPAGLFLTDALDLMGCTVVPAGIGQTELQVKLLHDLKPTVFISFPSFTMTVLKKAEEMGYDVRKDFNLKYASGGGERHTEILKKTFQEDYGLIVGEAYGCADLGLVAYGCEAGEGYHYDDEACVIEIVDPDTGKQVGPHEVGEVVATLFSNVYPLVRFGTGDLATYTDEPCPCGITAPRITSILGMIGEHIRVKGMFVHQRELDEAMSQFSEVSKYQMVLQLEGHRDRITLKLEVEPHIDRQAISEAINKRCQDIFKLRMDKIEFLAKGTLPEDCQKFVDTRWG